ncbi:uncharacterized protein RJT21DRAFT_118672 [Scheffersomyces amazonensis]|uniref:uncharacterized protein n=1 Tax=Scheffersomyces amazonensis TaxID=1078765 RepID=UPI00315DD17B
MSLPPLDKSIFPALPSTPKLVPVFVFNLRVEEAIPVLANKATDSSLTLARVVNGEVVTVKNDLGLEFDVKDITGFDDLVGTTSRNVTHLDCKLYGSTANGAGVYITYPGVVRTLPVSTNVLTGAAKHAEIEDGYVTCNPRFRLSDGVEEKFKWVLDENFIGKGRFERDGAGYLYVQYYIYILR